MHFYSCYIWYSSIKILPRIQRGNDVKCRTSFWSRSLSSSSDLFFNFQPRIFFFFSFFPSYQWFVSSPATLCKNKLCSYNATRLDLKSSRPALNLDRPTCFVVCVYVDAHGGPEHERKLVLEWKRNRSLDRSEKFVSLNNLFGLKTKIQAIFKLTWKKSWHISLYYKEISSEKERCCEWKDLFLN